MKSRTVPILRYQDADRAIKWLCDVIGFEVYLRVPGVGDLVKHARLTLDENLIMLASLGRDEEFENRFKSPFAANGITQCTSLYVSDPEEIYSNVLNCSANVVQELEVFEFGGKMFSFEDIEQHLWVVTSHDPWKKIW